MSAPPLIRTARLTLRRPRAEDAKAIFRGFASIPEATRFMSWRTHRTLDDTRAFLDFAANGWARDGVGAYLIEREGAVIGTTGLHPETPTRAETGYILRPDAWGQGYATEAGRAMVDLARTLGFVRVQAHCHVDHHASARVLEKCGMALEGILRAHTVLPNHSPHPADMKVYARIVP